MKRLAGQVKSQVKTTGMLAIITATSAVVTPIVALIVASIVIGPIPVQAQAAYGSYIGIGPAVGFTEGGGKGRQLSGVITGRYKFLEVPISARGQLFIGNGVSLVQIPTPSSLYSIPTPPRSSMTKTI